MHAKGPVPELDDPFRYGWRYITQTPLNGTATCDQIPLTLEDVLHPQPGDLVPELPEHSWDRMYLTNVLRSRALTPPFALVTSGLLIDWGVEGVRPHAPDIGVFVGMKQLPEPPIKMLRLAELQGRCAFVIEVVSAHTRSVDLTDKMREYHAAGVPCYALIDKAQIFTPKAARAFHHKPEGYVSAMTDNNGCVLLPMVGLRLGVEDDRASLYDAATGEEVLDYAGMARELEQTKRLLAERDEQIAESRRMLDSLAPLRA